MVRIVKDWMRGGSSLLYYRVGGWCAQSGAILRVYLGGVYARKDVSPYVPDSHILAHYEDLGGQGRAFLTLMLVSVMWLTVSLCAASLPLSACPERWILFPIKTPEESDGGERPIKYLLILTILRGLFTVIPSLLSSFQHARLSTL